MKKSEWKASARRMSRKVFVGDSLEELRSKLPMRAGKHQEMTTPLKAFLLLAFIMLAGWTILTLVNLAKDNTNPAWYTMLWFFGGLAFMVGAGAMRRIPTGPKARGLMVIVWALGILAVPFTISSLQEFNIVMVMVAILVGIPFIMGASRYYKLVCVYHEGHIA